MSTDEINLFKEKKGIKLELDFHAHKIWQNDSVERHIEKNHKNDEIVAVQPGYIMGNPITYVYQILFIKNGKNQKAFNISN